MPKVAARAPIKASVPTAKDLKPATIAKLKKGAAAAIKNPRVTWSASAPKGVKYLRVALIKGKTDQPSYTALIPLSNKLDPNKPKLFVLERSGGRGGTRFSGPLSIEGKPAKPLFDRLLTGQKPPKPGNGGVAVTEKFPSDNEEGGGGVVTTLKYPSDNEDGGGGVAVTEKYPSDNEDGGGNTGGGGVVTTQKYPSDNEDGGGNTGGGGGVAVTEKFPSDNEDGGGNTGGGGVVTTEKFPSDNEDGGGNTRGGGNVMTEKYPSDNDE